MDTKRTKQPVKRGAPEVRRSTEVTTLKHDQFHMRVGPSFFQMIDGFRRDLPTENGGVSGRSGVVKYLVLIGLATYHARGKKHSDQLVERLVSGEFGDFPVAEEDGELDSGVTSILNESAA